MVATSRKYFRRILSFLALVLLGLALWLGRPVRASAPSPAQPMQPPAAGSGLSAEGQVVPVLYASLAPAAAGQVEEVLVTPGQRVQAGDLLLRLAGRERLEAALASAEFELLAAEQALDQLDDELELERALARQALAETNKDLVQAQDRLRSLSSPSPQRQIDQARANLLLAANRLEKVEKDIRYWEKRFGNKRSMFWLFLDKGQFKDILQGLEFQRLAALERHEQAQKKYDLLLAPPDPIELAQAEARVSLLQEQVAEHQRRIARLEDGPDPNQEAAARARLRAAEAGMTAAQEALQQADLAAPLGGKVAELKVKPGEWAQAGQAAVILIDDRGWLVETADLTELDAPQVQVGQAVSLRPEALPELELNGRVEAIKPLFEDRRGDVTYTVRIALDQFDPRLRWGMTVEVVFQ